MIYICAGHTNKKGKTYDPGAHGNGYKESELTVELRDLIVDRLKALGAQVKTDNDSHNLSQTIFYAGTGPYDIVFDIHFNAATPAATGTECFIPVPASKREERFGKEICDLIHETLGINNRGVKPENKSQHARLGMMRPLGENVLCEVCFISNADDMAKYQANKTKLAARMAEIIFCMDEEVK